MICDNEVFYFGTLKYVTKLKSELTKKKKLAIRSLVIYSSTIR